MKVRESSYIKNNKPLFKKLVDELLKKYEYASVLVNDSMGKRYAVSKTGTNVAEDDIYTSRGYVVKVYDGGCYAEYSGNRISEEEIDRVVRIVSEKLVHLGKGADKSQYKVPEDETVSFAKSTECEIDPEEFGDEAVIKKLAEIHKKGMAFDEKVLNCNARTEFQRYSKLFLSKNKDLEQNVMWTSAAVSVNTKRGNEVKTAYESGSIMGGMEMLYQLDEMVSKTVKVAIELLDSEPIKPGEYECVCTPEVTGMIVHEAFGHGVEMDMFVKDRAQAKQFIGKQVASEHITMHDGNAVDQVASM